MTTSRIEPLIGVVGPCAAGKSTLIAVLRQEGFSVRHIAQEHSYVKNMWKRLTNPDILIFLDVSFEMTLKRRKLNWNIQEYQEQHNRLSNAREYANLYIQTDELTAEEVHTAVIIFLRNHLSQPDHRT